MRFDDLYVAGLGSWLPPAVSVAEALADGRYEPAAQEKNGYESITVARDEAPPDMAVLAGRQALEQSGIAASDISLLLHGSLWYQGIDFWPAASYVHREVLGDARHAPAIDVQQMSNAGLAAVELAAAYLSADPGRRAALITTADRLDQPGFDRWRSDLSGIVYGDGAAAMVLARTGFARLRSLITVSDSRLEGMYRGDQAFGPVAGHAGHPVDNRARRSAFAATIDQAIMRDRITGGLTEAAGQALAEAGLVPEDVKCIIFPNVGIETMRDVYLRPLKFDLAKTTWDWGRRTGHVGAGDQLIGLQHVIATGQAGPGDAVLLVGIGGGFSWTGAVLEVTG
jgi:3-oxoacyl-[acyl-carrier-protein] synthase-3